MRAKEVTNVSTKFVTFGTGDFITKVKIQKTPDGIEFAKLNEKEKIFASDKI